MVRWVSMTFSGVKRWREPSIWELKRHPSSVSLRHCAEREYLETAAVGQHRFVPCAETVDASRRFDDLRARPQVEMVGVGEDDARSRFGQVAVENAF